MQEFGNRNAANVLPRTRDVLHRVGWKLLEETNRAAGPQLREVEPTLSLNVVIPIAECQSVSSLGCRTRISIHLAFVLRDQGLRANDLTFRHYF
jgi:hypothetical protein